MSTLVPAWCSVKPSGPALRRAVRVAQKHAHAGLLSRRQLRRQEAGPIDLRQIQPFRLHGDTGRPQAQQRSCGHQSRPNRLRSIPEMEYSTRATTWRLHSASWAFRCRYRAESPGCRYRVVLRIPIGPGSSLVHATRQRVRSRTTKPGNMKRRTESQKCRKFCSRNPQQESLPV